MTKRVLHLLTVAIASLSASIASAQNLRDLGAYEPTLRDAIKNLDERVSTDPDPGEIYTTSLDGASFHINVNLYMQASCPNATFLHYPAYAPIGSDNFNYSARQAYHDFRGMAGDPSALIDDRVQAIQDWNGNLTKQVKTTTDVYFGESNRSVQERLLEGGPALSGSYMMHMTSGYTPAADSPTVYFVYMFNSSTPVEEGSGITNMAKAAAELVFASAIHEAIESYVESNELTRMDGLVLFLMLSQLEDLLKDTTCMLDKEKDSPARKGETLPIPPASATREWIKDISRGRLTAADFSVEVDKPKVSRGLVGRQAFERQVTNQGPNHCNTGLP